MLERVLTLIRRMVVSCAMPESFNDFGKVCRDEWYLLLEFIENDLVNGLFELRRLVMVEVTIQINYLYPPGIS